MPPVGANAASTRKMFAGMWVNAMVRISPNRAASRGARSCEQPPSTPAAKNTAAVVPADEIEAQVEPQHEQRRDDEPAAGRVEAEQSRELEHDASRRVQRPPTLRTRDARQHFVIAREPSVHEEDHDAGERVHEEARFLCRRDVPVVSRARAPPGHPTPARRRHRRRSHTGCRSRTPTGGAARRRDRRRAPARSGGTR